MCTHNLCLSKNKKNILFFPAKFFVFTTKIFFRILHGRVFVMSFWTLKIHIENVCKYLFEREL